jgi:DNA primase
VLVTEGEKAADAAAALFPDVVAITWPGGAMAVGKADWSPLRGRRVTIWPDADDAGRRAATEVAKACREAGAASVAVVAVPPDWPEGWDVADALPENATVEMLRELLDNARPHDVLLDDPEDELALEGLVARCATDPGAAFTPQVMKRITDLKNRDRATFESLRAQLKKAGVRVTALDDAIATRNSESGRDQTQADLLLELAQDAELFHAPDGTGYADIQVNGHRETCPSGRRDSAAG